MEPHQAYAAEFRSCRPTTQATVGLAGSGHHLTRPLAPVHRRAQEVARSPVSDIRQILKVNGKFFPAPTGPSAIREAASVPELRASAIAGNELRLPQFFAGKVSMLTVGFSAYSEVCWPPSPQPTAN